MRALYGSQAAVPFDVKGQPGCRYVIPLGEAEFDVRASAIGVTGQPFGDFNDNRSSPFAGNFVVVGAPELG